MVTFKQFVLESVPGFGDAEPTSVGPEGKPKLARINHDEDGWHFINAAGKPWVTVKSERVANEMKAFLMRKKGWKFKGQLDIGF